MKLELISGLVALLVKIGDNLKQREWRVCVGVEKKGETITKLEFASEGRKEEGDFLQILENIPRCQFCLTREGELLKTVERNKTGRILISQEDWKEKELGLEYPFVLQ